MSGGGPGPSGIRFDDLIPSEPETAPQGDNISFDDLIPAGAGEMFDAERTEQPTVGGELTAGLLDTERAASQRTSPVVRDAEGNFIRPVLGEFVEFDSGPLIVGPGGEQSPFDPETSVVLRDPRSGRSVAFSRTPETDQGALESFGRILLPGFVAGAPTRLASGAASPAVKGAIPAVREAVGLPAQAPGRVARETSRTARAERLADFTGAEVTPTAPAIQQSRGVSNIARVAEEVPVVGGPIRARTGQQIEQVGQRAEQIAGEFAPATEPFQAGSTVRRGLERFTGSAGRDFDDALRGADEETLGALITRPTNQTSFSKRAGALYERARRAIPESARTNATSTQKVLDDIAGATDNPQIVQLFENSILGSVRNILAEGAPTFRDLRFLRSKVRQLKAQPLTQGERQIENAQLKRIESALTDDMLRLAKEAGGEKGVQALRRADKFYRSGIGRVDKLRRILKVDSDEQVFERLVRLAQGGGSANARLLRRVKASLRPEEFNDVAAVAISRLGRPSAGQADAGSFSLNKFVTEFAKLSPQGKQQLFNQGGFQGLRQQLERLSRVAGDVKQVERLGNPSGSGRFLNTFALGAATIADLGTTMSAVLSGRLAAKLFMTERFAKWLVDGFQISPGPGATNRVIGHSERLRDLMNSDPELAPFANQLVAAIFGEDRVVAEEQNQGQPDQGLRPQDAEANQGQ